MKFLESTYDAILNRSPEELVGALFTASAVAIVVAGVYALSRRKSSPSPSLVGGLSLAAGALCMAVAAGYIEYVNSGASENPSVLSKWQGGGPGPGNPPSPWSFSGPGWSSGFHVVVAADENHDGRVTPEEVAQLVRKADTDGDGSVDFHDIDRLIMSRLKHPPQPHGLTPPWPSNHKAVSKSPGREDRRAEHADHEKDASYLKK